jgi:hypothetical protein
MDDLHLNCPQLSKVSNLSARRHRLLNSGIPPYRKYLAVKKIILLGSICTIIAFLACNQSGKNQKNKLTAENDTVLALAKAVFTPITESPGDARPETIAKRELGKMLF